MHEPVIRTFFACELSPDILIKIRELTIDLKTALAQQVRWVNTQNMHLTIQFLGEFKQTDVPFIKSQLQQAMVSIKPFELHIQRMGAFPSPSRAKVIWLGIDPQPMLVDLFNLVTSQTKRLGYPPEGRPFSAHITLGRVKPDVSPDDFAKIKSTILAQEKIEIGTQTVNDLHFIKSDLTPNGPQYRDIFVLPFSG